MVQDTKEKIVIKVSTSWVPGVVLGTDYLPGSVKEGQWVESLYIKT